MGDTTLLLIRHGQTEWNAAGRVQGQTNSDLTEKGRAQAEAVARYLAQDPPPLTAWPAPPTALYASDLGRTQQTAAPIAAALGLQPQLRPALREMNFGELEGLTWAEVDEKFPQVLLQLKGDQGDHNQRPPGGESRQDLYQRSSAAIEAIARAHPGETVAVVSHGGVIGYFIRGLLGLPFHTKPVFTTPNGGLAAFRYDGTSYKLLMMGAVPT